jgi:abnormal spindle-like microcephaly-associated protein
VLRMNAIKIQSYWRCFTSFVAYNLLLSDVVLVQSVVRRQIGRRLMAQRKEAVVSVQKAARRWVACRRVSDLRKQQEEEHRRQFAAAIRIQSYWRCYASFVKYNLLLNDVTIAQSAVRRRSARRLMAQRKEAVVSVQKAARCWVACRRVSDLRKQQEEEHRRQFAAVIKIQSDWRCYASFVKYNLLLNDVTIAQSAVRRRSACRLMTQRKRAVVSIQNAARLWIAHRQVSNLRKQREEERKQMDLEVDSSVTIQRAWRGSVSRSISRRHAAARRIQKTWRCFNVHVDYIIQLLGVINVQSCIRGFLGKCSFQRMKRGTIALQALARGVAQRKELARARAAAITVQSLLRAKQARSIFQRDRQAAMTIQRWTRGHLARIELEIAHYAACEIQRVWRGYNKFVDFAISIISAVKIQSVIRMKRAKLTMQELKFAAWAERAFRQRKAITIQRAFRDYVHRMCMEQATRVIQRAARAFLFRKIMGKVLRGVTRLQGVIRAQSVRRDRRKKVAIIARRVERANARAKAEPKLRLGYRTASGLSILQTSNRLSEIMSAVTMLETSTRLSIVCCRKFIKAKAADILLALIRSCNRSLPHVELLHFVLLTFDNVSKHDAFLPSLANTLSADVFMDLIQMFRDKDSIFCLSVALLGRILHCDVEVKVRIRYFVFKLVIITVARISQYFLLYICRRFVAPERTRNA